MLSNACGFHLVACHVQLKERCQNPSSEHCPAFGSSPCEELCFKCLVLEMEDALVENSSPNAEGKSKTKANQKQKQNNAEDENENENVVSPSAGGKKKVKKPPKELDERKPSKERVESNPSTPTPAKKEKAKTQKKLTTPGSEDQPRNESKNSRSSSKLDQTNPRPQHALTWPHVEESKARLAGHMDRVEFLASSRNLLTDLNAQQADHLMFTARSRSSPSLKMSAYLGSSISAAGATLTRQKNMFTSKSTGTLRLAAITKYVADNELQHSGKQAANAARKSGKDTKPIMRPYPDYSELYNLRTDKRGHLRDPPLLAVECYMPYSPPESALRHGTRKSSTSKPSTQTPSTPLRTDQADTSGKPSPGTSNVPVAEA